MNNHENLEAELRRLKPAPLPTAFRERLAAISPQVQNRVEASAPQASVADAWREILRWLVPVTAGVGLVVVALFWAGRGPADGPNGAQPVAANKPALKPNDVQIDRQLVAAYDAVAEMPGGEPVRFRCQQWMDELVLRDPIRGVQIEQRTPRFEIVAAKLETY
jgi:hypothetical protein